PLVEHVDDVAVAHHPVGPGVVLELQVEVRRRGEGRAVDEEDDVVVGELLLSRGHLAADVETDAGVDGVDLVVVLDDLRRGGGRAGSQQEGEQSGRFERHGSPPRSEPMRRTARLKVARAPPTETWAVPRSVSGRLLLPLLVINLAGVATCGMVVHSSKES